MLLASLFVRNLDGMIFRNTKLYTNTFTAL